MTSMIHYKAMPGNMQSISTNMTHSLSIRSSSRLVFTSDGVGVRVVRGVISAMESELEESECFHFRATLLVILSLMI